MEGVRKGVMEMRSEKQRDESSLISNFKSKALSFSAIIPVYPPFHCHPCSTTGCAYASDTLIIGAIYFMSWGYRRPPDMSDKKKKNTSFYVTSQIAIISVGNWLCSTKSTHATRANISTMSLHPTPQFTIPSHHR